MQLAKHCKANAKQISHFIKKHPMAIWGMLFLVLTLAPAVGFCDINSAFSETKVQVESIVSNRSGLFWIFMAVILGSGVWALYKGSWKGVGLALLIGVILGNFSGVIDTVLGTKIFQNENQHEEHRNG